MANGGPGLASRRGKTQSRAPGACAKRLARMLPRTGQKRRDGIFLRDVTIVEDQEPVLLFFGLFFLRTCSSSS